MLRFIRQVCNMKPPSNASLLHDVDIPTKKATFGMGCFWSNDSLFGVTPGVIRTRVGYSGGTTKNPHYRNLGDHTEVIEIDYDPKSVTYGDLLNMFWANHEYGLTTNLKRQYQSLILYHEEEQRQLAEASHKVMQERCNGQLRTEIAPAGIFYPAEDYHQKYRLQGHKDLCRSLGLDSKKLQTSHLAARLNGYLVGLGGKAQFEQDVVRLGLTEKQAEYVRREMERNEGGGLAC
ncbi:peptide methionine sulfoxide reductase isoform X1 [Leptidea sinapis]|uniref:peptide methionine sulfoxide reductase isoform X1 n=1 Tax=Leptidea sinapis TaxID=189913 RepID=UPI0021394CCA|nr:peptide methionine sulfoxide reductase isoform X1 [Leptidea sinapis]